MLNDSAFACAHVAQLEHMEHHHDIRWRAELTRALTACRIDVLTLAICVLVALFIGTRPEQPTGFRGLPPTCWLAGAL